jgi:hypothetical protein
MSIPHLFTWLGIWSCRCWDNGYWR